MVPSSSALLFGTWCTSKLVPQSVQRARINAPAILSIAVTTVMAIAIMIKCVSDNIVVIKFCPVGNTNTYIAESYYVNLFAQLLTLCTVLSVRRICCMTTRLMYCPAAIPIPQPVSTDDLLQRKIWNRTARKRAERRKRKR